MARLLSLSERLSASAEQAIATGETVEVTTGGETYRLTPDVVDLEAAANTEPTAPAGRKLTRGDGRYVWVALVSSSVWTFDDEEEIY